MKESKRHWRSSRGEGLTRWGCEFSGIISKDWRWSADIEDGFCSGKVAMYENKCFALGDSYSAYSIDIETGTRHWRKKLPKFDFLVGDLLASNHHLVVENLILDTNSGDTLFDLSTCYDDIPFQGGLPCEIIGNHLIRQINSVAAPGKLLCVDLASMESSILDLFLLGVKFRSDGESIVGWEQSNGKYILTSKLFPSSSIIWSNEHVKPGSIFCLGDWIIVCGSEITIVDSKIGDIKWRIPVSTLSEKIDLSLIGQYKFLVCEDSISIVTSNLIVTLCFSNGDTLWKFADARIQDACIAGDIIYGIKNEYTLFALDRYSGEVIWSKEDRMRWGAVMSHQDKIFFSLVTGSLLCYEWDSIYISSNRPNLT